MSKKSKLETWGISWRSSFVRSLFGNAPKCMERSKQPNGIVDLPRDVI